MRYMVIEEPSVFDQWIASWNDLVEFEIIAVINSAEASARWAADLMRAGVRTARCAESS